MSLQKISRYNLAAQLEKGKTLGVDEILEKEKP
jgi:hypothetical protein